MAYQVLARKWRPQRFADVVGQEHVTTTLANAIRAGRLAHAFLLCGPRGVGKTTTARILAKCLNCERATDGPVVEPCNECAACREIGQGNSLDVLEIDGASNRGIDEIRDLRENVRYAPSHGRAKVYVIDEVHMLTKEAFNALLKTLEEPPPSVYFVFATTEEHRVPATIRSRCQRYDFHRISLAQLEETLTRICEREGFRAEPAALAELARHAEGGLRDAESLLDQAAAVGEGVITREGVRALLGEAREETCLAIVEAASAGDMASVFRSVAELLDRGMDPGRLATGLAQALRDLLVASASPGDARALGLRADLATEYARVAAAIGAAKLGAFLALAGKMIADVRRASRPRLVLEIALARMGQLEDPGALADLARRLDRLAGGSAPGGESETTARRGPPRDPAPAPRAVPPRDVASPEATARPTASAPPSPPEDFGEPPDDDVAPLNVPDGELGRVWKVLVERVGKRKRMLGSFLAHGSPVALGDEAIEVLFENNYHEGMVLRRENVALIHEELAGLMGRVFELRAKVGRIPGARLEATARERERDPRDLLALNPGLKRVVEQLGGQILPGGQ